MPDMPNISEELISQLFDIRDRMGATAKAQLVISLSTITLMIDKEIITISEAAERIEQLQSALLPDPTHKSAIALTHFAAHWLRGHEQKPDHGWNPTVVQGGRQDNEEDQ